jgi:hypothetical protein
VPSANVGYTQDQANGTFLAITNAITNLWSRQFTNHSTGTAPNGTNYFQWGGIGLNPYLIWDDFSRPDTTNGWVGATMPSGHPITLRGPDMTAISSNRGRLQDGYFFMTQTVDDGAAPSVYVQTEVAPPATKYGLRALKARGRNTNSATISTLEIGLFMASNNNTHGLHITTDREGAFLGVHENSDTNDRVIGKIARPSSDVIAFDEESIVEIEYLGNGYINMSCYGSNVVARDPFVDLVFGTNKIYASWGAAGTTTNLQDLWKIDAIWAGSASSTLFYTSNEFDITTNANLTRAPDVRPRLFLTTNYIAKRTTASSAINTNTTLIPYLDMADLELKATIPHWLPSGGGGGGVDNSGVNLGTETSVLKFMYGGDDGENLQFRSLGALGALSIATNAGGSVIISNTQDAVTLGGAADYITIDGAQAITVDQISLVNDVTGLLPAGNAHGDITLDAEWDTSAEIAAAVGDEVGSGALVFGTTPTFTTEIGLPSAATNAPPSGNGEFLISTNSLNNSVLSYVSHGVTYYVVATTNWGADDLIPKVNANGFLAFEADAGAAGGDSITVDTAETTDPDFKSAANIVDLLTADAVAVDWVLSGGNVIGAEIDLDTTQFQVSGDSNTFKLADTIIASNINVQGDLQVTGAVKNFGSTWALLQLYGTNGSLYSALGAHKDPTSNTVHLLPTNSLPGLLYTTKLANETNQILATGTSAGLAGVVTDETGSGLLVFGTSPTFLTSINIPNATDPTTDAAGEIAIDSDDDFIEIYGTESRVVNTLKSETFTIVEPDQVQGVTDAVLLKHFPTEAYPFGATIKDIIISTGETCTDALNFEEWSNNGTAWSFDSTIEAITLSGTRTEDDGTLADALIAADAYVFVDLADAPTDINYMEVTITYTITPGD